MARKKTQAQAPTKGTAPTEDARPIATSGTRLIGRINPGSIRSVADMVLALELVISDVFDDVASIQGVSRIQGDSEGDIDVVIDDEREFRIIVRDGDEHWKQHRMTTREAFGVYAPVFDLARKLGHAEAVRRLEAKPGGLSEDEAALLAVAKQGGFSLRHAIQALSSPAYRAGGSSGA